MVSKLLGLAIVLSLAAVSEAAPIYTNLDDNVVQLYQPGLVVEFVSVDPFRYGGFIGLGAEASETLDNPFSLGPLVFDGKYFRVSAVLPAVECGVVQVDADSHDFAGIGRLFVTGQACGGGTTFAQLPPSAPSGMTPELPQVTPHTPGGENPQLPPGPGTPVPEPSVWMLLTTGILTITWRTRTLARRVTSRESR